MSRRVVLAQDVTGEVVAVGPVARDGSVAELRDAIEAAGWTDRGPARYLSAAQFRAEVAKARLDEIKAGAV